VVFVGCGELDVDVEVAFANPVPLTAVVTEPWRRSCEELEIMSVVDEVLTFPVAIEEARFGMDPNTPEVVEAVIVEEYDA
jgi:hypothetical protein